MRYQGFTKLLRVAPTSMPVHKTAISAPISASTTQTATMAHVAQPVGCTISRTRFFADKAETTITTDNARAGTARPGMVAVWHP
jgi:hypothetical protein